MKKYLLISPLLLLFVCYGLISQELASTDPLPRNVVLEEFTGIYCGFCPYGHEIGQGIMDSNPGRVVLINIHTGSYAVPKDDTHPDFQTEWGSAIAGISGLKGYPAGQVNRQLFEGSDYQQQDTANHSLALSRGGWEAAANDILNDDNSPVNIGAKVERIGADSLHITVELYYTADAGTNNKLNIALLEDGFIGYQGGSKGSDTYEHNHILRDLVTGQWGEEVEETSEGTLFTKTYDYEITGLVDHLGSDLKLAFFVTQDDNLYIYTGIQIDVPALEPNATLSVSDNPGFKVNSDMTNQKSFIIENISEEDITFDIVPTFSETVPEGWSIEMVNPTENEITVAAGATETITLGVKTNDIYGFGELNLKVTEKETEMELQYAAQAMFISGEITQIEVLSDGEDEYSLVAGLESSGYNFFALTPEFYNATKDLVTLEYLIVNTGGAAQLSSDDVEAIGAAIENGTNVMVCGSRAVAGLSSNSGLNDFGVDFVGYSREGYYSPWDIVISGVPGEPIAGLLGDEIEGRLLGYLAALININDDESTKPILKFKNDVYYINSSSDTIDVAAEDAIIGVKKETDGSRLILLAVSPYVIRNSDTRETFVNNCLGWLANSGAEVTVNATSINFGMVGLSQTINIPVTITNTGSEDLVIESINFEGTNSYVFQLKDEISFPLSIRPGNSEDIWVSFRPTIEGDYNINMIINSNAWNGSEIAIALLGHGGTTGVYEESNQYFNMAVIPNPIEETAILNYNIDNSGNNHVDISLYGLAGNKIMNIYEGYRPEGTYTEIIYTDGIPSGRYFIIASVNGTYIYKPVSIIK